MADSPRKRDVLQKPFADYDSFEACTEEHSDKEDPAAYCAQIHYEATGEWPSEKTAVSKMKYRVSSLGRIEYRAEALSEGEFRDEVRRSFNDADKEVYVSGHSAYLEVPGLSEGRIKSPQGSPSGPSAPFVFVGQIRLTHELDADSEYEAQDKFNRRFAGSPTDIQVGGKDVRLDVLEAPKEEVERIDGSMTRSVMTEQDSVSFEKAVASTILKEKDVKERVEKIAAIDSIPVSKVDSSYFTLFVKEFIDEQEDPPFEKSDEEKVQKTADALRESVSGEGEIGKADISNYDISQAAQAAGIPESRAEKILREEGAMRTEDAGKTLFAYYKQINASKFESLLLNLAQ